MMTPHTMAWRGLIAPACTCNADAREELGRVACDRCGGAFVAAAPRSACACKTPRVERWNGVAWCSLCTLPLDGRT